MTITELNNLSKEQLVQELSKCCGSRTWVNKMTEVFPVMDYDELVDRADEKWVECKEEDWLEAFSHHPKIGDINSLKEKFASTAQWASGEQSGMQSADENIIHALADANADYEKKFGFIFIVCATGKSASQMLELLEIRMKNERDYELRVAAAEQAKITKLRLEKLIS
ncbi:MAG: uraD [Bacteroidota bacterium]|nr:uraD [Bacteroidota bacterium]